MEKSCTKCKVDKSITEFSKDSRNSDLLSNVCKQCHSEKYHANKEQYKNYYKKNRDKILAYQKNYYNENREDRLQYQRNYYKLKNYRY